MTFRMRLPRKASLIKANIILEVREVVRRRNGRLEKHFGEQCRHVFFAACHNPACRGFRVFEEGTKTWPHNLRQAGSLRRRAGEWLFAASYMSRESPDPNQRERNFPSSADGGLSMADYYFKSRSRRPFKSA